MNRNAFKLLKLREDYYVGRRIYDLQRNLAKAIIIIQATITKTGTKLENDIK